MQSLFRRFPLTREEFWHKTGAIGSFMKFCFQPYIERPKPTPYATWASVLLRTAPGLRTGLELELLLASTLRTRTGSTLDLFVPRQKKKKNLGPLCWLGNPCWTSSTPFHAPIMVVCMGVMSSSALVSFSPSWMKLLVSQDSALLYLGPRSLSSSRVRYLGFLESCLLHCMTCTGLQGLVKMLDELILEVLLSTLKPCINTKLQNRHARMNLLYQGS
jgi:hypothetical protein